MTSATANHEFAYYKASVVSALAAGIAAQLYAFFRDTNSYYRPTDLKEMVNCDGGIGGCPHYSFSASTCYFAMAINLAAVVDAFIVKDLQRQEAAGDRLMSKYLLRFAHLVCLLTIFLGIQKVR
ncbi:hypothetical protein H1R20_g15727, partial [Candolleomyces eurysporus]